MNRPAPVSVHPPVNPHTGWSGPGSSGAGTESGRYSMTRVTALPAGIRRGLIPAAAIATSATLAVAAFSSVPASAKARGGYRQINLVSDQTMKDTLKDPDLVNAWGLAASPGTNAKPGSPLWVADNGTDKATLYAGTGPASVAKVGLVVRVRGAAPTGQIFNPFPHAF